MKMLKYVSLFAVVCILMACVVGNAFAADSKTNPIEIVKSEEVTVEAQQENDVVLTKEEASRLADEKVSNFKALYQWNISATNLPQTLKFLVTLGANQRGFVYHYEESGWKLMGKVNEDIVFNKLSPVAVAIFESTSNSGGSTGGNTGGSTGGSPKTGENGLLTSLAIAAIAMGGAAVFFSKKKD